MPHRLRLRAFALSLAIAAAALAPGFVAAAFAASPPCFPCAGVHVDDPAAVVPELAGIALGEDDRLYVSWSVELDGSADAGAQAAVRSTGATPWVGLTLRTAVPVLEHVAELDAELAEIARLAGAAPDRAHFQLDWRPPGQVGPLDPVELAFIVKRAAVAVTGADADARVLVGPLAADPAFFRTFYGEDVAAYVDGLALAPAPADALAAALATIAELDPGKPVVLDHLEWPTPGERVLARAAEGAVAGFAVTLFAYPPASGLAPLATLAREFQGDLSADPATVPAGPRNAWTFVRGEDLSLRTIAELPEGVSQVDLVFSDPQLKAPQTVDLATGERATVFGQRRTASGLVVPVEPAGPVVLVALERMTAAEIEGLGGLEERVDVESERGMPVEEILRRLQAFEDAQARRLHTYQATNTMHLRFRVGSGVSAIEAAFRGPFFLEPGKAFDWAWEELFINGVKWRGKKLPEIPLIQPEKAAALPLEIHFTKEYRYRLRGTDVVDGRPAWVVDFAPAVEVEAGRTLFQGTVWVDQKVYARLRTRALQVGLEGEVLSNEETQEFTPVDERGNPQPWDQASTAFVLPLRIVGQQLLSVLNATTQVEKETVLTELVINGDGFAAAREAALNSDSTMVRDTDKGMRYLEKTKDGERVVEDEIDTSRLFAVAGTFYDASLDYPLPLLGVNYLDLDFRKTGSQVNVFFAGALLTANVAQPHLFGSKWDVGANAFGFFIDSSDELFANGEEVPAQEVETKPFRLNFFLGRPLGSFFKLDFTYGLAWDFYGAADDTDPAFVVPEDTLTHRLQAELTFNRAGYTVALGGSLNQRQSWDFWGLPGASEWSPDHEEYLRWQVSAGKSWWLPKFQKIGVEVEHLDGRDLDRFSKYSFSFFGDGQVAGYQSGLVRAEEANAIHLSYGLNLGQVLRLELRGDAAWASDEETGLSDELLSGVSLNGTFPGPWTTLVNLDLGVPVDGPADDFVAYLVFLKLFG